MKRSAHLHQLLLGEPGILLLAALLGLATFFSVYDWETMTGSSPVWRARHGDAGQAIVGWQAFVHDEWRLPLLETRLLRAPDGTSIILTDSLPLLALPAKALRRILPSDFVFFGYWLALCFVLQAVAAVLALDAWGVSSPAARLAGAAVALALPAWIGRYLHLALCGQFVLLLACAATGARLRAARLRTRVEIAWAALLAVALLIHVYLFVMVGVLWLVSLVEKLRVDVGSRRAWLAAGGATVAGLAALMLVCGYFSLRGQPLAGFGTYSMNLLQPWWPTQSSFLGSARETIDATGGQGEGMNYLGAGLLLLLVVSLAQGARAWWRAARRLPCLVVGAASLSIYSLSNVVYVGGARVLAWKVPSWLEPLTDTLRSSGRFFWPVAYLLIVGSIAVIAKSSRSPRQAALVFAVAAVFQTADASTFRAQARERARWVEPARIVAADWSPLLTRAKRVVVLPTLYCSSPESTPVDLEIQRLAVTRGIPVNSGHIARPPEECAVEDGRIRHLRPEPGTLYVFLRPVLDEPLVETLFPVERDCLAFSVGFVCAQGLVSEFDAGGASSLAPATRVTAAVDQRYSLLDQGAGDLFLGTGWWPVDRRGAWSRDEGAWLLLPVPAGGSAARAFRFQAAFAQPRTAPGRRLELRLGGERLLGAWQVRSRTRRSFCVELPPLAASDVARYELEFRVDPVAPRELDPSRIDRRRRGVHLQAFELVAAGACGVDDAVRSSAEVVARRLGEDGERPEALGAQ